MSFSFLRYMLVSLRRYLVAGSFLGITAPDRSAQTRVSSCTNGAHGSFIKMKGVSFIYSSMVLGHSFHCENPFLSFFFWLAFWMMFFVDINVFRHFAQLYTSKTFCWFNHLFLFYENFELLLTS